MACFFLFGHTWNGCKCEKCGKVRKEQHDWDLCRGKCRRCGAKQTEQHDWDGCKCKHCGKVRNEQHDWDGCMCKRCGKTRDEQHDWDACLARCKRCGKKQEGQHDWNGCMCIRCAERRNEGHDFQPVEGKCYEKCAICGKIGTVHHDFQPVSGKCKDVCSVCGEETYETHHDYQPVKGKCEEKCAVCGETREIAHQYAKGKCQRCGVDVNAPDSRTHIPPLIQAAFNGKVNSVRELLAAGANVNICTDETPLMAAARKGYDAEHIEIVKLLLQHGANVNATDPYGSSALRLAQRKGLSKMVELLASHGGKYLGA